MLIRVLLGILLGRPPPPSTCDDGDDGTNDDVGLPKRRSAIIEQPMRVDLSTLLKHFPMVDYFLYKSKWVF